MEQEDIERELLELAREWTAVSKLRTLPGHVAKESYAALWKQLVSTQSRRVRDLSDYFIAH